MLDHVGQHARDMLVGCLVEHLFIASRSAHQPRRPQQPQMVTDQRRRSIDRLGDVAHCNRRGETREQNAQPCRITQQAIGFGNHGNLGVAG